MTDERLQEAKAFVRALFPDSDMGLVRVNGGYFIFSSRGRGGEVIGVGNSEGKAWLNATERLRAEKESA